MSSKLNKNLKVGRRTGVVIASPGKVPLDEDGMEKFDAFWDSEQPNEQNKKNDDHNNDNEGGEKMDDHDAEDGMKRSNNTNKTTAKFNVTNVTEIQQDEKSKAMYTKLTKRVIDRNKKLKEKGVLLSPSTTSVATEATEGTELTGVTDVSVQSPVLTNVTPAPERSDDHEEEEEERSENDQEDVHNDDVATSPASAVAAAASMSPITPGDVSIGSLSIEKGFLGRKKKLETLIEDEEKYSNENESENDMELGADVAVDEDGIGNERDISGDERESSTTNNCDNVDFGNDDDENMDDVNYSDNDEVSVIDEEETPMKVRRERAKKERKRLEAKKRAKRKKKKRASSSGSVVSFSSPMSVYLPAGPREYNNILVSDLKDSDDEEAEDKGVRRSRRTRFAPLKFWKNERVVYGPNDLPTTFGDMPVAATVQQALPTPMKKMHRQKPGKKSKRTKSDDSDEEAHISAAKLKIKKFDKKKLKKEYSYKNDKEEIANVWDEGIREFSNRQIVARAAMLELVDLPVPKKRSKFESKIGGKAVQAFNVSQATENIPGWISGNMILPPTGIKDAENVGFCTQIFFVGDCQPGSFEVAVTNPEDDEFDPNTAQRFLLSKGDFFHVPPHNIYRVENHSETDDANLFWCIVRQTSE